MFGEFRRSSRRHQPHSHRRREPDNQRGLKTRSDRARKCPCPRRRKPHARPDCQSSRCVSVSKSCFRVDDHFISAGASRASCAFASETRGWRLRGARGAALPSALTTTRRRRRCGMNQHRVARLYWIGAVTQIVSRHPLKHGGRRLLEVEFIGNLDETIRPAPRHTQHNLPSTPL